MCVCVCVCVCACVRAFACVLSLRQAEAIVTKSIETVHDSASQVSAEAEKQKFFKEHAVYFMDRRMFDFVKFKPDEVCCVGVLYLFTCMQLCVCANACPCFLLLVLCTRALHLPIYARVSRTHACVLQDMTLLCTSDMLSDLITRYQDMEAMVRERVSEWAAMHHASFIAIAHRHTHTHTLFQWVQLESGCQARSSNQPGEANTQDYQRSSS